MTLDLRLLGQLAVIRDGHRLELRSRPAQLLLAYLALHAGQSLPRDKVAGALWPDSDGSTARKNLRQALWRLRRAIGDEHLDVDPQTLRLAPGTITSDVDALLHDVVPDDPDDLASTVESFGELLPGHYEDWIQSASGPLQATYDNRMARLLRVLAERGRWEELRGWAERWIALGAVPEPAYRALMRAHAGMGDLAGVADTFLRCRAALQELGLGPTARTTALHERLMTGDLSPLGSTGDHGTASTPMPAFRFDEATPVIEHSIVINRPQHEVFASMLDPGLALLYRSNVLEYDVLTGSPGEEGTQVRGAKKLGREIFHFVVQVIEADPGRWLVSRTIDSPVGLEIETELERVSGGTRMTQRRRVELPVRFSREVDNALLLQWYAADMHADFERLKQLLERR